MRVLPDANSKKLTAPGDETETGFNDTPQHNPLRRAKHDGACMLLNAFSGAGFALIGAGFISPADFTGQQPEKETAP